MSAQGNLISYFLPDCINTDDDGDGMPDDWEIKYGLNPLSAADASGDLDDDDVDNLMEYRSQTDPTKAPQTTLVLQILDVQDAPVYETWLPAFGHTIKVQAVWTGLNRPDRMVLTLTNTSKYPGRAVNDPDPAKSTTYYPIWYDFHGFDFGLAGSVSDHSYSQGPVEVLDSADGAADGRYTVYLQCYDWLAEHEMQEGDHDAARGFAETSGKFSADALRKAGGGAK